MLKEVVRSPIRNPVVAVIAFSVAGIGIVTGARSSPLRAERMPVCLMVRMPKFAAGLHRTNEQKPIVPNSLGVNLFASLLAALLQARSAAQGNAHERRTKVAPVRSTSTIIASRRRNDVASSMTVCANR